MTEDSYRGSRDLAERRRLIRREELLILGAWLPKGAYHHSRIQWSGEGRWACRECHLLSVVGDRSPATVPCRSLRTWRAVAADLPLSVAVHPCRVSHSCAIGVRTDSCAQLMRWSRCVACCCVDGGRHGDVQVVPAQAVGAGPAVERVESGPSLSFGVRGAHVTVGRRGVTRTVGFRGRPFLHIAGRRHTGVHTAHRSDQGARLRRILTSSTRRSVDRERVRSEAGPARCHERRRLIFILLVWRHLGARYASR